MSITSKALLSLPLSHLRQPRFLCFTSRARNAINNNSITTTTKPTTTANNPPNLPINPPPRLIILNPLTHSPIPPF